MGKRNRSRRRSGLRPIPGDEHLFVHVNLQRDPVAERLFVEQIRKDIEQLTVDDRVTEVRP